MGKKQHSKDRMYVTATEWKRDFGGKKSDDLRSRQFKRLPFDCCALSFLPFETPVTTTQGHVFDLLNIVPYITKMKKNPVTGVALTVGELIRLHFHKNTSGEYWCPVTFKSFNEHTHIVAVRQTGNVYSMEAIEELNIKPKNWFDLLNDTPFKREDLITIQDPHNFSDRNINDFFHLKEREVVAAAAPASTTPSSSAASAPKPSTPATASTPAQARALYSTGACSGSFTSTAMTPTTSNARSVLTEEQIREQRYTHLKKEGTAKGYIRLHTSLGNLNLELFVDKVPRTCHSFLEHCEKKYYVGTKFHRLIKDFMIQSGDPTGLGTGGEGAFEKKFKDEFHPSLTHSGRGILSMANSGPNTNGSQFFLLFAAAPHLDNKHVVFGRVVGGHDVLDKMEAIETWKPKQPVAADTPKQDITITNITIYTNPFLEAFEPKDELTGKHVQEEKEEVVEERGLWFSAPLKNAPQAVNEGGEVGKYMAPKAAAATSLTKPLEKKRKHPALSLPPPSSAITPPTAAATSSTATTSAAALQASKLILTNDDTKRKVEPPKAGGFGDFSGW